MSKKVRLNRTAVFLDRDNTIIEDPGYVDHPDKVALLPGAAEAIRRFHELGYLVIIASNQSGIARGLFTEEDLRAVHERVEQLLAQEHATLDDAFYCPYLDGAAAVVEAYRTSSRLRKPRPGMLLEAARTHQIDLSRSWMIGDSARDVEAGRRAGCRTVLISADGSTASGPPSASAPDLVVGTLLEAAERIERITRLHAEAPLGADAGSGAADAAPQAIPAVSTRASARAGQLGAPAQAAPGGSDTSEQFGMNEDAIAKSLEQIHTLLDRTIREQAQEEFSILRLLGGSSQLFALAAAAWGILALFGESFDAATSRLVLACFLQLAAATAFIADRTR